MTDEGRGAGGVKVRNEWDGTIAVEKEGMQATERGTERTCAGARGRDDGTEMRVSSRRSEKDGRGEGVRGFDGRARWSDMCAASDRRGRKRQKGKRDEDAGVESAK